MTFWTVVRFLHLMSAILWVGGQLILSLVVRPIGARELDPEARSRLMRQIGARYGRIANLALIPLILATGLALAYHHGVELGGFGVSSYATVLTIKIILVFVSFGLAIAHGVIASRASSSSAARTAGIAGAIVSVVIVLLAVMLVT